MTPKIYQIGPQLGYATTVTSISSSPYNVLPGDYYVGINRLGNSLVQLPAGVRGRIYVIKDESGQLNGVTNTITVSAQPGQTIDGINSAILVGAYASLTLIYTNNWYLT